MLTLEPRPEFVDVAVVGLGPVGATLANLLGAQGLSVCVLEREAAMYALPRAGHFDGEVMRVWQSIGLADRIEGLVRVNPGMRFVGADKGLLVDWSRPQRVGPQGWYPSYRFHQPDIDAILREGLGRFPSVKVYLDAEVTAVLENGAAVEVRWRDRAAGRDDGVRARYVVGCDGARSIVRRTMGVAEHDLGESERWLVVDLVLTRPRDDLGDVTIQHCDPRRPTTYIRMVGDRRRWEFMVVPGDTAEDIDAPASVWRLLRPWIGPEEATIERAVVYTFQAVFAARWRAGRLLLAGDAAHRTPPFLGQGMCAGIRDAMNLAWKLAAVVRGRAGPGLLDTYAPERIPHVREYLDLALRLGRLLQTTDPARAAERDAMLSQRPEQLVSIKPRLGPSSMNPDAAQGGGLSEQIRLSSGPRLDDAVGLRFAVLAGADLLREASSEARAAWAAADALVLENEGSAYLDGLGARAAIVRPDRYLLGLAHDAAGLDSLSRLLPQPSAPAP